MSDVSSGSEFHVDVCFKNLDAAVHFMGEILPRLCKALSKTNNSNNFAY